MCVTGVLGSFRGFSMAFQEGSEDFGGVTEGFSEVSEIVMYVRLEAVSGVFGAILGSFIKLSLNFIDGIYSKELLEILQQTLSSLFDST